MRQEGSVTKEIVYSRDRSPNQAQQFVVCCMRERNGAFFSVIIENERGVLPL